MSTEQVLKAYKDRIKRVMDVSILSLLAVFNSCMLCVSVCIGSYLNLNRMYTKSVTHPLATKQLYHTYQSNQ